MRRAIIEDEEQLVGLDDANACRVNVTAELPFTNQKEGYTRDWAVDGPGQISTTGTYTAPGTKPTPDVATVTFTSRNDKTTAYVRIFARVKIVDFKAVSVYKGTIKTTRSDSTTIGNFTWNAEPGNIGATNYKLSGTVSYAYNDRGCTANAEVAVTSTANLFVSYLYLAYKTPPPGFPADLKDKYIGFSFGEHGIKGCTYPDGRKGTGPFSQWKWEMCDFVPITDLASLYRLKGSCTKNSGKDVYEWDFVATEFMN